MKAGRKQNVEKKEYYLAYSHELPKVGERFACERIEFKNRWILTPVRTSKVVKIEIVDKDILKVETVASVYFVKSGETGDTKNYFATFIEEASLGSRFSCMQVISEKTFERKVRVASKVKELKKYEKVLQIRTRNSVYFVATVK